MRKLPLVSPWHTQRFGRRIHRKGAKNAKVREEKPSQLIHVAFPDDLVVRRASSDPPSRNAVPFVTSSKTNHDFASLCALCAFVVRLSSSSLLALPLLVLVLIGCTQELAAALTSCIFALLAPSNALATQLPEPIAPLPQTIAIDSARASIGERLFHDPRLSHGNDRSCATCHPLDKGGAEPRSKPVPGSDEEPPRNIPTVFNVGFNFSLNWDGALSTLEAHAEHVLLHPKVMNTTWSELLAKLRQDSDYAALFRATYKQDITRANVLDAVASFERALVTPNSRFDRHLRGEAHALTAEEHKGYELFKSYGCVACHQGMNLGGNLFQKFGVFQAPDVSGRAKGVVDLGRYTVTKVARDREVFRVPSLRNVAVTAPYFHDGRAATLEVAVDTMAKMQLGRQLSQEETGSIVQFLRTLTGEWRGRPLPTVAPEAR